jgi:membrane-associated phospholipid phosphatase
MVWRSPIRMAHDYNRTLWAPVRWSHVLWAATGAAVLEALSWCFHPVRRYWAGPLLIAAVFTPIVMPFDHAISHEIRGWFASWGGDIRREIQAWQQYGAVGSLIFAALVIGLLDAAKVRRVWDLALGALGTVVACNFIKMFVGRPRPKYDDAATFLWPGGEYPITRDAGPIIVSAIDGRAGAELWSMPSSHTAAAAALSVFLVALYPRLRWLGLAMVGVVAVGRTMAGNPPAHWPSDVIVGGCLGWLVSGTVVRHGLGVAIVEAIERRGARADSVRAGARRGLSEPTREQHPGAGRAGAESGVRHGESIERIGAAPIKEAAPQEREEGVRSRESISSRG